MSQLNIEKREAKENLRNLRLAGKIPAVIYGDGKESDLITIVIAELMKERSKAGFFNRVVTLVLDGKNIDVLAKDVQVDPVRGQAIHADFMRVNKNKKIRISVPVYYHNADKSAAIKRGGVLNIVHHSLEVRCSPYEIPASLECDLSDLETAQSVTLSKLKLPKNVVPVHPERDNVLATVVTATTEDETKKEETAAAATA